MNKTTQAIKIKNVKFICSCPKIGLLPKTDLDEIFFSGRSNVGKSSLLNSLINRRRMAFVSKTPGRTREINYFEVEYLHDQETLTTFFVDLPGFGYARVGKKMQRQWGPLVEDYLVNRQQLKVGVHLIDSRRKPERYEIDYIHWLFERPFKTVLVATKIDKISLNRRHLQIKTLAQTLKCEMEEIIPFSTLKKIGREQLLLKIFSNYDKI